MKKLIYGLMLVAICTSCATILTSKPTAYQKTKPSPGAPQREVRTGYFIAGILCGGIPLAVDYATCKIYRPAPKK